MTNTNKKQLHNDLTNEAKVSYVKNLISNPVNTLNKDHLKSLTDKYGPYAYDIVKAAQTEPKSLGERSGQSFTNTNKAVEYFATHDVPTATLAKALNKKESDVLAMDATIARYKLEQNKPEPAQVAEAKKQIEAQQQKIEAKIDNREPIVHIIDEKSKQQEPAIANTAKETTTQNQSQETSTPTQPQQQTVETVQPEQVEVSLTDETQINNAYQVACGGAQKDKTSIESLIAIGVTPEDFETLASKQPELIQKIGGGKTCEALAKAADEIKTEYVIKDGKRMAKAGMCLTGVQEIHTKAKKTLQLQKDPFKPDSLDIARSDSLFNAGAIAARQEYRVKRAYQGASNGGCSGAASLEASGDYVTIGIKNEAYGKTTNCPENKKMNDLFYGVQKGVTMTVDSIEDQKTRIAKGNTAGGKYGHIAVKTSDPKKYACDFEQRSINFPRYGEYAYACFPKDAQVPEEYAKLLIIEAQERSGQCLDAENNKKQYLQARNQQWESQKNKTTTLTPHRTKRSR